MSLLEDKAQEVCRHLVDESMVPRAVLISDTNAAQFDPTIIVTLAGFIAQIVQALMTTCNKTPTQAAALANKPSVMDHVRLRIKTRQYLRQHPNVRIEGYPYEIADAVLLAGHQMDGKEMAAIYKEVRSQQP